MKATIYSFLFFLPILTSGQIQLLNDEFNADTTLDEWFNINDTEGWDAEHLEVFDIDQTTAGHLHMMPWSTSWYQDYRGPLLFKLVDQNFIFTTEISATNRLMNGTPSSSYSLAGVMIRAPRNNITNGLDDWTPGGENYVFLSTGTANPVNGAPHLEIKTTQNSVSNLQITPILTSENVRIRIARIDQHVICMYKSPGANWVIRNRYNRNDLPAELQVGLVTYTDWPKLNSFTETYANSHVINAASANPDSSSNPGLGYNPDLIGLFDFARFDSVTVPPPLIGANLSNPGAVSDAELLAFLGQPSQPLVLNNIQYELDTTGITIQADPDHEFVNIYGNLSDHTVTVADTSGNIIDVYENVYQRLTIDTSELPAGPHQIIIENELNAVIRVQRFIKLN